MTIYEAIKEERDKHRNELQAQRTRRNLTAQGIMFGTDIGAGFAGRGLVRGLMSSPNSIPVSRPSSLDVSALAKLMDLDIAARAQQGIPNASYQPAWLAHVMKGDAGRHGAITVHGRNVTSVPADVAAHEIGHAMAWNRKAGLPAQLISRARFPAALAMLGAPFAGLIGGATGNKPLATREKWLNRSSAIAGAGSAAVLADEAIASRNAFKVIAKLPPQLRDRVLQHAGKRLGRAFGTYGLTGLGLVLGPQLAKRYYRGK